MRHLKVHTDVKPKKEAALISDEELNSVPDRCAGADAGALRKLYLLVSPLACAFSAVWSRQKALPHPQRAHRLAP
jgi:hypothetical protein